MTSSLTFFYRALVQGKQRLPAAKAERLTRKHFDGDNLGLIVGSQIGTVSVVLHHALNVTTCAVYNADDQQCVIYVLTDDIAADTAACKHLVEAIASGQYEAEFDLFANVIAHYKSRRSASTSKIENGVAINTAYGALCITREEDRTVVSAVINFNALAEQEYDLAVFPAAYSDRDIAMQIRTCIFQYVDNMAAWVRAGRTGVNVLSRCLPNLDNVRAIVPQLEMGKEIKACVMRFVPLYKGQNNPQLIVDLIKNTVTLKDGDHNLALADLDASLSPRPQFVPSIIRAISHHWC